MYIDRLIEYKIKSELSYFGAVCIYGAKFIGKSETSKTLSKSEFKLLNSKQLINSVESFPDLALSGEKPRFIDEWQYCPFLWEKIKDISDNSKQNGLYILSGSATPKYIGSLHSGAGRISIIEMENLTLQEMNFVEKKVNFMNLFCKDFHVEKINEFNDNENGKSIFSNIVNMVKGGFPKNYVDNLDEERCINKNKKYIASITRCYEEREGVKPLINFSRPTMVSVIYEISRNTGQAINYEKLAKNIGIAPKTFRKYISILEEMHLIYFLEPWKSHINSNANISQGKKIYFVDPCIPIAALNTDTLDLLKNTSNFINKNNSRSNKEDCGLLFECQIIKQLRIFTNLINGKMYYFRNSNGLEADCVIEYKNKFAVCEIKLGSLKGINDGCISLDKIKNILSEEQIKQITSWNIISGGNFSVHSENKNINIISINHLFLDEKDIK